MEDDHRHDQDGSHDSGELQKDASKKKKNFKPRGPAKGLKQRPGVVREIEWDEINRPIGKWKTQFVNHIGCISRKKVSILIDSWEKVPQRLKDTLWLDVKREFHVEENPVYKAKVLQKCCKAWKGHKTKLVSGWIEISRPTPQNKRMPYEIYRDHISQEVWNKFVEIHSTEEAKKKRAKSRHSQSFNKHPHNLGQHSYADMVPVWREDGLMPPPSTSSMSSSGTCTAVSAVSDRTFAWVLARSKQDEEGRLYVPNEETRMVKDSIDEWTKKQKTGEFVPGRLDDALSRALGKRDRHGRTLGFGSGIPIKQVWGPEEKGKRMRNIEIEEMERRVSQKVREGTLAEVTSKLDDLVKERVLTLARQMGIKLTNQMMEVVTNSPITPHILSSCQSGGINSLAIQEVNDKEPRLCRLALSMHDSMERVIVADGLCYPQIKVDQHKPILPENMRVRVDSYDQKYEDVPVPVPSARIRKLSQAHGTFVQWPKELIILSTEEERISKEKSTAKRNEVVSGAKSKKVANGNDALGKELVIFSTQVERISKEKSTAKRNEVVSGAKRKKVVSGNDAHGKELVISSNEEERISKEKSTAKRNEVVTGAKRKKVVSGNDTKGSITKRKNVSRVLIAAHLIQR